MKNIVRKLGGKPIRVLIVDDSALFRRLLAELLSGDERIEVVGAAPDPHVARRMIKELNPDVLTLDVEMGAMDGLTFLGHLMRLRPMPVVMVSSLTERGAAVTLEALSLGAVDFVTKPKMDVMVAFREHGEELRSKVLAASQTTPRRLDRNAIKTPAKVATLGFRTTEQVIAIGSSTGGTEAVREIIEQMPGDAPGIMIAQHIPESFSATFATRLNDAGAMTVREAQDGDPVVPGHAYVAPGGQHLELSRSGTRFQCRITDAPRVNHHRPSVDVLFNSVAKTVGRNAIGLILTGMGNDGAEGLLQMKNQGAHTICQDEQSSVVWGMPGSAVKLGAASEVLPLGQIASGLLHAARKEASTPAVAKTG